MVLAMSLTDNASLRRATSVLIAESEYIAVDLVTSDSQRYFLDSFMLEAVGQLHPWAKRLIHCREWAMSQRRGREFAWLLGARTFPQLYINGRLWFSGIPSQDELYGALALAARGSWQRECIKEARVRDERAYRDEQIVPESAGRRGAGPVVGSPYPARAGRQTAPGNPTARA
jgi:hypothetical protein